MRTDRPCRRHLVSGNGRALAAAVDGHLAAPTDGGDVAGDLAALIAPHAGLMFSGPVAAHAYRLLARPRRSTSRSSSDRRISSPSTASRSIRPAASRRRSASRRSTRTARARSPRHRPIVHERSGRPRARTLARNAVAVPRASAPGSADRAAADRLSDRARPLTRWATRSPRRCAAAAPARRQHRSVALSRRARPPRPRPRGASTAWRASTPTALQARARAQPEHACGGGPTVAVMRAARAPGARDAVILNYADSGDVSGDKSAVVGYLAAALGTFQRRRRDATMSREEHAAVRR